MMPTTTFSRLSHQHTTRSHAALVGFCFCLDGVRFRHLLRVALSLIDDDADQRAPSFTRAHVMWLQDMKEQVDAHMAEFDDILRAPLTLGFVLIGTSFLAAIAELIRVSASSLVGLTIPLGGFVFNSVAVAYAGTWG